MAGTATISWLSATNPVILSPVITDFNTDVDNGAPTTHDFVGVPAGALLVLSTGNEEAGDGGVVTADVNSSPVLTWTKQVDAQALSSGNAEIWTAIFSAGGSITVTSDWGGSYQSSVCYVVTGQEAALSGATNTGTAQAAPSVTISSTKVNSILFCITSDFNAADGDGGNRTYRVAGGSPTEVYYVRDPAEATFYHYYYPAASVTSYTVGLSAPGTQAAGTAVLEIRAI